MKIYEVYLGAEEGGGNIGLAVSSFLEKAGDDEIYSFVVGKNFERRREAKIKEISYEVLSRNRKLNSISNSVLIIYIKPRIYMFDIYDDVPYDSPSNFERFSKCLGFKAKDYIMFGTSLEISKIILGIGINNDDSPDSARLKLVFFSAKE